jgi:DNA-directed RNA polymerase subunit K/omega
MTSEELAQFQSSQAAKPSKQDQFVVGKEIQPLDLERFYEQTNNIYYSVAILGERANQISSQMKQELNDKLAEFGSQSESLEEITENREQIEIAKHYEQLPKPTLLSIEEFLNQEIYFRNDSPNVE